MAPDTLLPAMKQSLSVVAQKELGRQGVRLPIKGILASSIYMVYMTLLLLDKFKVLLALTAFMFWVLKSRKGVFTWKHILLQVIFLFIATRCFWLGMIPEAKFFIIYIFAFYSGGVLAPIIAAQSTRWFFLYITIIAALAHVMERYGVHLISLEIEKDILLTNYAEILAFHLLAAGYLSGELSKLPLLVIALFSGSKFLIISSMLMSIFKRLYVVAIPLTVIVLFFLNPYGSLDSRISLYSIFIENFNMDIIFLGGLTSVNDLLTMETSLYSFHNIWLDYLWCGGVVGIFAIFLHLSIIFKEFNYDRMVLERSVILMYLICITFGFSVFFGTKYMALMLGVIIYKQRMEDVLTWVPKSAGIDFKNFQF